MTKEPKDVLVAVITLTLNEHFASAAELAEMSDEDIRELIEEDDLIGLIYEINMEQVIGRTTWEFRRLA